MRQLAWLNAVPKPPEGSKRAAAGRQETVSRLAQLKRDKLPVPLPPNPMPHLTARLTEIGLSEPAGMGVAPLSWATLDTWQRITGIELEPWEARLLRVLSAAYTAESRAAECETAPSPWRAPVTDVDRRAEVDSLRMVLG